MQDHEGTPGAAGEGSEAAGLLVFIDAGVRRFTELVAEHSELTATAVQTVGGKGYDGFVPALVTD